MTAPLPGALRTLAERACTAAGTDLAAVLADLHGTTAAPATPAAIRAGWTAPDTLTTIQESA